MGDILYNKIQLNTYSNEKSQKNTPIVRFLFLLFPLFLNIEKNIQKIPIGTSITEGTEVTLGTLGTTFTKDNIVLLSLLSYKSIKEISEETLIPVSTVGKILQNGQRNSGLLVTGEVEKYSEICSQSVPKERYYVPKVTRPINRYIITPKGIKTLKEDVKNKIEEIKHRELIKNNQKSLQERIETLKNFLQKDYFKKIEENLLSNKNYLNLNFTDLMKLDPQIAELILDHPEETIKELQIALKQIDFTIKPQKNFYFRIKNLPKTQEKPIGGLRTKDLDKLIKIRGSVVINSDVRPKATCARFTCTYCDSIVVVLQNDEEFKKPKRCGCGKKDRFRLLNKDLIDFQKIVVEELTENIGLRSNPTRLTIFLREDLTRLNLQPYFQSSSPITINGILKETNMRKRYGGKSSSSELYFEAISIEFEDTDATINITDKEKHYLEKLSQRKDIIDYLVKSFVPGAYNLDLLKESVLLSLVSGGSRNIHYRDDSHLLLVGDPGTMKSTLMMEAKKIMPGSRWVSGKSSSGVGLIGSVTKDENFGKGVVLEKGALPLSNMNVCFVDELDKMNPEDTKALHEALENQVVYVNKWNIHQQFHTDCTCIAACNPKNSFFSSFSNVGSEINLVSSLLDRFDQVLIIRDSISDDEELVKCMQDNYDLGSENNDLLDSEVIRKYLFLARQFKPTLDVQCKKLLKDFFVSLRKVSRATETNLRVSRRQYQSLERLVRAAAKLRFSDKAEFCDALRVIKLRTHFFSLFGLVLDEVVIEEKVEGVVNEEDVISFLESNDPEPVEEQDLVNVFGDGVECIIKKLKEVGDVYFPRSGFVKLIK